MIWKNKSFTLIGDNKKKEAEEKINLLKKIGKNKINEENNKDSENEKSYFLKPLILPYQRIIENIDSPYLEKLVTNSLIILPLENKILKPERIDFSENFYSIGENIKTNIEIIFFKDNNKKYKLIDLKENNSFTDNQIDEFILEFSNKFKNEKFFKDFSTREKIKKITMKNNAYINYEEEIDEEVKLYKFRKLINFKIEKNNHSKNNQSLLNNIYNDLKMFQKYDKLKEEEYNTKYIALINDIEEFIYNENQIQLSNQREIDQRKIENIKGKYFYEKEKENSQDIKEENFHEIKTIENWIDDCSINFALVEREFEKKHMNESFSLEEIFK